ncbi:MAG: hypothetical protein ACOC05_05150 [Oceanicaulis sp.]
MASLPATKIEKLRGLLSALPGDRAERLCKLAWRSDPGLARVLEFCRSAHENAVSARFFAPLEPVSGEPGVAPPSRSYAPAGLSRALWRWLGDALDPDLPLDIETAVLAALSEPPAGRLDPLRKRAADALCAGLDAVKDDPRAEKRLKVRLELTDFTPVRHVISLLRSAPVVREALKGLPPVISEADQAMCDKIRDRYEAAAEADPDAAVWALYLIMTRFEQPWRLLRVFERIARRDDDLLVSQTDMSHIGEALLADAEFYASRFAAPPATREAAVEAAEALTSFAAITVGMTREIGVRKDGAWGKRLVALRTRASEQMAAAHDAARDVLARAVPEGGAPKGRRGPRDGENLPERAEALCLFMNLTRDDAARAAVGGAHASLISEIVERLESAGQQCLAALREVSGDPAAAQVRAESIAVLMRAIGEGEAAALLLRRTAAACTA